MAQSILVWLLFESEGAVLMARRKPGRPPFADQWVLPGAAMPDDESAEETLARFAREELGIEVTEEEFAETLYLAGAGENCVTNVFNVRAHQGELRFRTSGDFSEMRWLSASDVRSQAFAMPAALRAYLGRGPERAAGAGTPDNKAAWDAISFAYQAEHRLKTDAAHYGPRMPTERDLRLLGDVRGKNVLEIGCGGGQCSIAFAREGALATGIDQSAAQLSFARDLAAREGVRVNFLEGDITRLPQIATGSQDAVFSAYALIYVEDILSCFAEVARVLKPRGAFVFSVDHPLHERISEDAPFAVTRPYWDSYMEWQWGHDSGIWMRSWARTIEEWVEALHEAGFRVERLLEPRMLEQAHDETWDDSYPLERGRTIPTTLIIKAAKV